MKRLVLIGVIATTGLLVSPTLGQVADVTTTTTSVTETPIPVMPPPNLDIARILPYDTPYVITLSTKSEVWGGLNRFVLFKMAGDWVSTLMPKKLSPLNFDYQRNIESKVGDRVAIAFLPKTKSTNSIESSFVFLVQVKDPQDQTSILNYFKPENSSQIEHYKGVTIYKFKPDHIPTKLKPIHSLQNASNVIPVIPYHIKSNGYVVAALPGYIVAGQNSQPIEQIIDSIQASTSTLASNPNFQQTFQNPRAADALATLYLDPEGFLPLIPLIAKDENLPFPIPTDKLSLKEHEKLGAVNGLMTLQPEGLRFQLNTRQDIFKFLSDNKGTLLPRLPAATYTTLTGNNLNDKWQTIATGLSKKPEYKKNLEGFRQYVRKTTGLDFERDIMGWMNGEYAAFLFPTKGGSLNSFSLGIGLALKTNDHAAADRALNKFNQLFKSWFMGELVVNTRKIKGQTVTSWDALGDISKSLFAYSWLDDKTLVMSTGVGAMADLVPQPHVPLSRTYNFTTATSSLPNPNDGYFYLNMGSMMLWVYGFLPSQYINSKDSQVWKQAIGSIYSISGSCTTKPNEQQLDILFVLAPNRKTHSFSKNWT